MCKHDPFRGDDTEPNNAMFIINGQSVCDLESHIVSVTTGNNISEAIYYLNNIRKNQRII